MPANCHFLAYPDAGGVFDSGKRDMTELRRDRLDRRGFLAAGASALLLAPLTACQTAGPTGAAVRASARGKPYLERIRAENGVGALRPDYALETAALRQARLMAENGDMNHRTAPGRGFRARMNGVVSNVAAGENIAYGRFDVARVMSVWMLSPPHRRNLLDPAYTRYGLAYVADGREPERRYWAIVLAGS